MDITVLWITASLLIRQNQTAKELQKAHDELALQVAERTAELRTANLELIGSQEQLRGFSRRLIEATENERRSIRARAA